MLLIIKEPFLRNNATIECKLVLQDNRILTPFPWQAVTTVVKGYSKCSNCWPCTAAQASAQRRVDWRTRWNMPGVLRTEVQSAILNALQYWDLKFTLHSFDVPRENNQGIRVYWTTWPGNLSLPPCSQASVACGMWLKWAGALSCTNHMFPRRITSRSVR
jgi:hypothetical protein